MDSVLAKATMVCFCGQHESIFAPINIASPILTSDQKESFLLPFLTG